MEVVNHPNTVQNLQPCDLSAADMNSIPLIAACDHTMHHL
jgi:hypothetical protein